MIDDPLRNHPVTILYSDEDECYLAVVSSVRHCTAHGDSPEEALREVREALTGLLEVATEHGDSPQDYEAPRRPLSS